VTIPSSGRKRETSILDDLRYPKPIRLLVELMMYVLGPVSLYRNNFVSTRRTARTFTAEDEASAHPDLVAYVAAAEGALQTVGFGPPHRIVQSPTRKVTGFAALLEHPGRGDLASFMGLRSENPQAEETRLVSAAVFMTEFADDVTLATSNVTTVKRFPTRPDLRPVVFPDVHDPLEVYRLHRCRVDERTRRVPSRNVTRGATPDARIEYQDRESERVFEHWVRSGYYRRVPDGMRPTLRGAALMTWRGMWPWRLLTERRHARAARAVQESCSGAQSGPPERG
jgi:hypothetical protein